MGTIASLVEGLAPGLDGRQAQDAVLLIALDACGFHPGELVEELAGTPAAVRTRACRARARMRECHDSDLATIVTRVITKLSRTPEAAESANEQL